MKRKSPLGFVFVSLTALLFCVLTLHFVAVNTPKSVLGENLFRWEYARSHDKVAYLQEYRAQIWARGGYVPDNAARFFCRTFE